MSEFTHHTRRQLRQLFNQYADEIPLIITKRGDGEECEIERKILQRRLGVMGLQQLLWKAMTFLSDQKVIELIYKYDTSCTGTLNFQDFMLFYFDFQTSMELRKKKAVEEFENYARGIRPAINALKPDQLSPAQFLERYPTIESYLVHEGLNDPKGVIFGKPDNTTDEWTGTRYIRDPKFLKRRIVVRVSFAKKLNTFFSPEVIKDKGIFFKTMNPMVRVQMNGIVKETGVLLESTMPQWEQDLVMPLDFSEGEIADVVQAAQSQNIEISLFDIRTFGGVAQPHLLGRACIPVIQALLSTRKPLWVDLNMVRNDGMFEETEGIIEVGVSDDCHEEYCFAKILDSVYSADEIWCAEDATLFEKDLCESLTNCGVDENEIFENYTSIKSSLRKVFKTRMFDTLGKTEEDTLIFLPSFIQPMKSYQLNKPTEVAEAIASIPYRHGFVPCNSAKDEKRGVWNKSRWVEKVDWDLKSCLACWSLGEPKETNPKEWVHEPWKTFAHNPYLPVLSPTTILSIERRASLMEKAVLMTSLFVGMGLDAYVAVGNVKNRPYVWVITIEYNREEQYHYQLSPPQEERIMKYDGQSFNSLNFERIQVVNMARQMNRGKKISYWDVVSGAHYATLSSANVFIEVLFNHKNLFYNIQKEMDGSRKTFVWDLNNTTYWIPLIPKGSKLKPFPYQYSVPEIFNYPIVFAPSAFKNDKALTLRLFKFIQMYRRENFKIQTTFFHRDACQELNSLLDIFEKMRTTRSNSISNLTQPTPEQQQESLVKKNQFFQAIHARMEAMVPAGSNWHVDVFRFLECDLQQLVFHLAASGLLDNRSKDVLYIIAVKIVPQAFGMHTIWVGVGYAVDFIYQMMIEP